MQDKLKKKLEESFGMLSPKSQIEHLKRDCEFVDDDIFLTEIRKNKLRIMINPETSEITHKLPLKTQVKFAMAPVRKFIDIKKKIEGGISAPAQIKLLQSKIF